MSKSSVLQKLHNIICKHGRLVYSNVTPRKESSACGGLTGGNCTVSVVQGSLSIAGLEAVDTLASVVLSLASQLAGSSQFPGV